MKTNTSGLGAIFLACGLIYSPAFARACAFAEIRCSARAPKGTKGRLVGIF